MYLVDTSVISAVGPTAARPIAIEAWLDAHADDLCLSVVTVTEIGAGIAKVAREGATRKARLLSAWWDAVERSYARRIFPFDLRAAKIAGELQDLARGRGHAPGFADMAIAATAIARDLVVVTRNTRHFAPLGCRVHNPFELTSNG